MPERIDKGREKEKQFQNKRFRKEKYFGPTNRGTREIKFVYCDSEKHKAVTAGKSGIFQDEHIML